MSKEDAIEVDGTVVEVLANRVVRVELANGHQLLAHGLAGRLRAEAELPLPGARVRVALSPFDLSKGRLIERQMEVKI